ncbi:c-type cytochrome [Endozoicomonas montiporae]|uniref:Cytochrome c, class I (C553-like) n=1 Tax=Endozoicomonas montiporae CL-33 TaxID=570277 RepID=A0A142B8Q4_9GAMM|nr:c-type cytochrome [Endozoicomonas montiporae]AMO55130.1 cytochrome c, class I precursor (c553-like) [Endozoicomonas montiporae CL-33]
MTPSVIELKSALTRFPLLLITIFLLLSGCSKPAPEPQKEVLSPEMQAARNKALVLCSGCHGPEGIGTADFNPNLACQKQVYLARQLRDYREGRRTNHIPMVNIAKMLTEEEVDSLSRWYSQLNCPKNQ